MEDAAVAQFTEITGSAPHLATQYLQLTDYNLQTAMQLYFENGGAEIGPAASEPAPAPSAPAPASHLPSQSNPPAGYQDEAGVVHIDSDDAGSDLNDPEITGYNAAAGRSGSASRDRSAAAGDGSPGSRLYEDDAAMARRLQEELYAGGGGASQGGGVVDEDGVRAPMARTTETLVGPGSASFDDDEDMSAAVLRQLQARDQARQRSRPGIFNQTADGTSSIWNDGSSSRNETLARATGGASEASSKSSMLAEMYRPPFDIMSKLSWEPAREEGRENERWLLVNIQDSSVFDCQVLNRDLWKNPGVVETIKENFIFLQFSKDDPRGATYIQYYFPGSDVQDNYPHIAIVDPRTGEQVKVWSGPPVIQPADFLIQLHEFLDRYSLKHNVRNPVARRKPEVKAEKKIEAMTEEEMMEMALKNSLAGQSPSKQEDPDDLTRSFTDAKGKGKAVEDSDEDLEVPDADETEESEPSESAFRSIPSDRPHVEPDADPATTTRIQFRHPSGRVIRRFALADTVQRIYEWLKSSPLEGKEGVEFELVTMGKNLIDSLETTIEDAGLKNGTVMIGFLED